MGAATAAAVAAEASDRLRGVALEDPPWWDGSGLPTLGSAPDATGSRAPLRSPAWAAWLRSLKTMTPAERYAMADAERPTWASIDRIHWADNKALVDLAIIDAPLDIARPPWREIVARITCPILLLTADPALGGIVTPEAADEAARLWRTGRVVRIADAGHNLRRDNYAPYHAAVATFLREIMA
jgi:pimeloyl-ACP methyl ester carboxylesterase